MEVAPFCIAVFKFQKVDTYWEAKVPKAEFAPKKPEECTILLVQKGKRPVRLVWERG